jgi:hypothetical protein
MLHPLFATLIQRPDLWLDHASAYAALIEQEAGVTAGAVVKRAVAWAMTAAFGVVFFTLTGVAVMLGFVLQQFHWTLVAAPAVALALMLLSYARASTALPSERFVETKAQLLSDAQALRAAL